MYGMEMPREMNITVRENVIQPDIYRHFRVGILSNLLMDLHFIFFIF